MVVMTLVTIPLMDKLGRRVLHLGGLAGMCAMAILIVIAQNLENASSVLIAATLAGGEAAPTPDRQVNRSRKWREGPPEPVPHTPCPSRHGISIGTSVALHWKQKVLDLQFQR